MAIGVQTPLMRQIVNPGQEAGTKKRKFGLMSGLAIGALVGATAATGGAGAIAAGALAGAGGGATVGGIIGESMDKKGTPSSASMVPGAPGQVEKSEGAISRKLQNVQADSLQTLGQGLQALGASNDHELQQTYVPPVFRAYVLEHNRRAAGPEGIS